MLQPALTWWPVPVTCCVCRSPAYHLMSFFLPTLMDDLWSTVTQDNSPLISLRFLARYNKSWWSMTSSISSREKPWKNLYLHNFFWMERSKTWNLSQDMRAKLIWALQNFDCGQFLILYCDPRSAFLKFLRTPMIRGTVTFTKSPTNSTQGPGKWGGAHNSHVLAARAPAASLFASVNI